jgi:hypothetical protein
LHELEHEEAVEAEIEITDLDPLKKSGRTVNWWLHGQRLSSQTRQWMALLTILGVALFSWLLVSPLHLTGASNIEQSSYGQIFTPSNQAPPRVEQVLVVQRVIYVLDQDGLVQAFWTRHKYTYLLWQYYVTPSSKLLKVVHNVMYLAAPNGRIVALRASDGAFLWTKIVK